jgi:hypothetical protein
VFETSLTTWLANVREYSLSLIFRWVSGYGEKPLRVAFLSAAMVVSYALTYSLTSALTEPGFVSALYFSTVTFTTLGYGDVLPRASSGFRLLAASEAVLGVLMVGLFLFTLSRRSVGRA